MIRLRHSEEGDVDRFVEEQAMNVSETPATIASLESTSTQANNVVGVAPNLVAKLMEKIDSVPNASTSLRSSIIEQVTGPLPP
jgi:hypothetical protein